MSALVQVRCEHAAVEAGNVKVFSLHAQHAPAAFLATIVPGGYVAIDHPDLFGVRQQRHYSVVRKAAPDRFEIAVRRTGSNGIADTLHDHVTAGTLLSVAYAAGNITAQAIAGYQHVFMLAGGIGLTLPMALVRELRSAEQAGRQVPQVTLYVCTAQITGVPFLHELLELDLTCSWFSLRLFVTQTAIHEASHHFRQGRPTDEMLGRPVAPDAIVICGSHAFAAQNREKMTQLFPDAEVLIESFSAPARPQSGPDTTAGAAAAVHAPTLSVLGGAENLAAAPAQSLLDILDANKIPIRSQCRSGICGSCQVTVVSGACRREVDFCLNEKDVSQGLALACCTYPVAGPVVIALRGQAG